MGITFCYKSDYYSIRILIANDMGIDTSMDIVIKIISTHPRGKLLPMTIGIKPNEILKLKSIFMYFLDKVLKSTL